MPACSLKKPQRNKREIQNSLRSFAPQEAGRKSNVHDILSEIVFSSRVSMRKIPVASGALLGILIRGVKVKCIYQKSLQKIKRLATISG